MVWKALQYGASWSSIYNACDQDTQDTIDRRFGALLEQGSMAREPISKPLQDGIFELRAKNARFLFYFGASKTIIFVHAILKRTRKVSPEDIKLAKRRRAEILANEAIPNAFIN
jgi:phage-related protein